MTQSRVLAAAVLPFVVASASGCYLSHEREITDDAGLVRPPCFPGEIQIDFSGERALQCEELEVRGGGETSVPSCEDPRFRSRPIRVFIPEGRGLMHYDTTVLANDSMGGASVAPIESYTCGRCGGTGAVVGEPAAVGDTSTSSRGLGDPPPSEVLVGVFNPFILYRIRICYEPL